MNEPKGDKIQLASTMRGERGIYAAQIGFVPVMRCRVGGYVPVTEVTDSVGGLVVQLSRLSIIFLAAPELPSGWVTEVRTPGGSTVLQLGVFDWGRGSELLRLRRAVSRAYPATAYEQQQRREEMPSMAHTGE
jgi:hypothetical protein